MDRKLLISITLILSLLLFLSVHWQTPITTTGTTTRRLLFEDGGCLARSALLPNSSSDPAFIQLIATSNAVLGAVAANATPTDTQCADYFCAKAGVYQIAMPELQPQPINITGYIAIARQCQLAFEAHIQDVAGLDVLNATITAAQACANKTVTMSEYLDMYTCDGLFDLEISQPPPPAPPPSPPAPLPPPLVDCSTRSTLLPTSSADPSWAELNSTSYAVLDAVAVNFTATAAQCVNLFCAKADIFQTAMPELQPPPLNIQEYLNIEQACSSTFEFHIWQVAGPAIFYASSNATKACLNQTVTLDEFQLYGCNGLFDVGLTAPPPPLV